MCGGELGRRSFAGGDYLQAFIQPLLARRALVRATVEVGLRCPRTLDTRRRQWMRRKIVA
jgi:hypothetical protein